ncbi:MAG TPA: hypothetical protein VKT82_15470 [Ktedonobacterales bacterium]|nr:hypothetical protein [Ktedonobacterales bacterium]
MEEGTGGGVGQRCGGGARVGSTGRGTARGHDAPGCTVAAGPGGRHDAAWRGRRMRRGAHRRAGALVPWWEIGGACGNTAARLARAAPRLRLPQRSPQQAFEAR